ncbi:hypothetical protein CYMTET_44916 [Cymbomonas tetramitiformis]|uniref:Uncharacterized protein n=1 Tax=Cymbomonas tetramitiformis TaxID=36881 RepID=A0AAE0C131_9CHLO|nr:hypothetical protein CYMTET_44916 [Cymbomonas tetramitiformis]
MAAFENANDRNALQGTIPGRQLHPGRVQDESPGICSNSLREWEAAPGSELRQVVAISQGRSLHWAQRPTRQYSATGATAPVLLKAGLLWTHLAEAGEKLQEQVHPGQTTAAGALTAQDLFEHPAGEPLHTIFSTGGAPGGQYDTQWNMTVPRLWIITVWYTQSIGLVGQGVAEVANSISAGVVLEGGARNIVYIGKGSPHWEETRAAALDVAIVVFSRADEADKALRLGLPYEFYGHPVTVHRYSSTADITKFQEWELELIARPPEGRHWHSADRAEQVLSAAKRELRTLTGMEVFPVPSPPSERGVGEYITLAQPLPDRDSREACRYWMTVEAATYEAVSHRISNRLFFHIGSIKFHIACSPRSRWMAQRNSPQQLPRQRARYAGKGQGKGGKGAYYGQVQPTQLFGQDQGYGRQQPPAAQTVPAPQAGSEISSLAASVKALTEVVISQQVQASDRQMSAITQLSGHQVTGLLQHGVQLMPQGGQSYLTHQQQTQQLQPPPASSLQLPQQVPLGPPQEFDNPDGRAALKRLDELRAQERSDESELKLLKAGVLEHALADEGFVGVEVGAGGGAEVGNGAGGPEMGGGTGVGDGAGSGSGV